MASLRRIPLFPLGTVLYPGEVLPLHIFEERYRQLITDLSEGPAPEGDRAFGVVAIRAGREVGRDGVKALYDVGTLAVLRGVEPHDDGRFDVVTMGGARFTLVSLDTEIKPYVMAEVDLLDEADGALSEPTVAAVRSRFMAYRAALQGPVSSEPLPADPATLAWCVAEGMLLDLSERQRVLAADDTAARLRVQRDLLRRELALFAELPSLPALDLGRLPLSAN